MNTDDFESRLSRQPLRAPPPDWRREILTAAGVPRLARQEREPTSALPSDARRSAPVWWLVWLNPSRPGWIALGAAWLLILALNFAGNDDSPKASGPSTSAAPQQWRERQRLMAELIEAAEPAPPRPVTRPRSERRVRFHILSA